MAANINFNSRNSNNNNVQNNEDWRADGFINFQFVLKDGSSFKIDALALKASKSKAMEKLVAFLDANPEKVDEVINRCTITYRSAHKADEDVDLGL